MSKEKKMRLSLPEEELVGSGNLACQGCGANLALRYVLKAFGKRTVICIPACCWAVIDGAFPHSCLGIPVYHCAFETAASTATGVKAGLEMVGDAETQVIAWAGDGGTFDIGIQALSGAAERNDDILYVCYDNEAYMNTGIQRSSATPLGAWTTTTPVKFPKDQPRKTSTRSSPPIGSLTKPPLRSPIPRTCTKRRSRPRASEGRSSSTSTLPARRVGRAGPRTR